MKRNSDLGKRVEGNSQLFGRDRPRQPWNQPERYWACEDMRHEAQQILRRHEPIDLYVTENETDYQNVGRKGKNLNGTDCKGEELTGKFTIFSREDVERYLSVSKEWDMIPLDQHLFCVLNTQDYLPWDSASTLVFYDDGLVLRTKETTNAIMERLFQRVGIPYDVMRSISRVMGGKRPTCSPYTVGNTCYLPVNGPSKNAVTWISLAHVTDYKRVKGERNRLQLEFLNRHRLELQMRRDTFEGHLMVAAQTLATHYHLMRIYLHHNGMDAIQREHRFSNNILQQWLRHNKWRIDFNLGDMGRLLLMSEYEHLRRHPSFKDNPFTEEIWSYLNKRLFDKEE